MKRAVLIIIIVGMFGWAIYDFVKDDSPELTQETGEESEGVGEDNKPEQDEPIEMEKAEVGLERGQLAPDFEITTLDGDVVNLSDFRGERVLLNFWASWCGPCRAEMPDMQKFHEDTDVELLAVNLTETESNKDNITDFLDEFGITFTILLDENSKVSTIYNIKPIPTTFLINSDGTIHNKAFGALNYDQMVQESKKMD